MTKNDRKLVEKPISAGIARGTMKMLLIGGFEHTIKFFFDRGQFHKLHLYGLECCEEYQMNGVFSKPLEKGLQRRLEGL